MTPSNTSTRVLVSVVAIPLIIAASYFGSVYFYIFVMVIGLVAYYEFNNMALKKGAYPNQPFGIIAIALIITNQFKPVV